MLCSDDASSHTPLLLLHYYSYDKFLYHNINNNDEVTLISSIPSVFINSGLSNLFLVTKHSTRHQQGFKVTNLLKIKM